MNLRKRKQNSAIEFVKNNKLLTLTSMTLLCLILVLSTVFYKGYPILIETILDSNIPVQLTPDYQMKENCYILKEYYGCNESKIENIKSFIVGYTPTSIFVPFVGKLEGTYDEVNMLELCRIIYHSPTMSKEACRMSCLECQTLPDGMPCQNEDDCRTLLSWYIGPKDSTWLCIPDDLDNPNGPKHCTLTTISSE